MHYLEHNGEWEGLDGVIVRMPIREGGKAVAHRLRVRTYEAIYPTRAQVIDVHAEPVNKAGRDYRQVRDILGDDWSTDVLDSSVELAAEVLRQARS